VSHAYIVEAVRTPRGRGKPGKGALSSVHPQQLLAQTLSALAGRARIDPALVEDVIVGCVSQAGEQGANLARNALLDAGWPVEVPGTTLNRMCGSGLQAVGFAAMGVMAGLQELVVAGGVESMSRAPMGSDGARQDGENLHLRRRFRQVPQGISADLIATLEGFTREDVDRFALLSQQRAAMAMAGGHFARGTFPVVDPSTGAVALEREEFPRPGTTLEALARLEPSFAAPGASPSGMDGLTWDEVALAAYPHAGALRHVHTAGNSSGIVDGAAAVLVASESALRGGLRARARIRAIAAHGSEPVIMLTGPAAAARKALQAAGMSVRDVDLWEINEAFASVVLLVARQLELDLDRVNVNGGAIALGHPLGATGAILLGTMVDELERRNLATGLVALCIAGGQAVAMVVERV
jgi:acetyl-CoA C-acetyltransferase